MHVVPGDPALTEVYVHRGPFLTVHLDATPDPSGTADLLDQRWSALRDTLTDADPESVDAIEESLTADIGSAGAHGILAIAAEGELCLSERLPVPPARDVAVIAPLPDVVPYLLARDPVVSNLIVAVHEGRARILEVRGGRLVPMGRLAPSSVVTDDQLTGLARGAARLAAQHDPEVVAVVGDADSIPAIAATVEQLLATEVTVRPAGPGDRSVLAVTLDILRARAARTEDHLVEHVRRRLGARSGAAAGGRDVLDALRTAQVETVLLDQQAAEQDRCWVGSRPTELWLRESDGRAAGADGLQQDRLGSAVVRAAFATGATVVVGAGAASVRGGIAASLR